MNKSYLPSVIKTAIRRNAHRIANSKAYAALRDELHEQACDLWLNSKVSPEIVIEQLDRADVDYVPRINHSSASLTK
jgi:hypothetical protein